MNSISIQPSKTTLLPKLKWLLTAISLSLFGGAHAQGVFDFGATAPTPGLADISQLTGGHDNGGSYYVDSGNPGQTFTTGSNPQGYSLLNIYIKTRSSGAGGGQPGLSAYTLRIYSLTNTASGTATLITTYVTTNQATFTQGDWFEFTGLTNLFQPNAIYGFALSRNGSGWWEPDNSSSSLYAGGIASKFPTATAVLATTFAASDMTFDLNLIPFADPLVTPTIISPANPVYAGTPVTLSATVGGTAPFTSFVWQSDGATGGATWSNLAGSATNTFALATSALAAGNYQYRLIVTSSAGTTTNTPSTLILSNAAAPFVVANTTITPNLAPVGGSTTISATFGGTLPIYYQWLFADSNGIKSLVSGGTSNVLVLSNIEFTNAGTYSLIASNNPGGVPTVVTNTPASLSVRAAVIISASPTPPTAGSDDIAQLDSAGDVGNPDNLNYYDNNGAPPGQTFTTGNNPNGYTLNALYYLAGGPVINNGSHPAAIVYTLRIYSISGSAATLISTYVNDNSSPAIPNNTWVKWTGGLTNTFAPSSTYAYSIISGAGYMHMGNASNNPSFYSGGELALLPTASGTATFGTSHNTDATFLVNLVPTGLPAVQFVSISPASSPTNPVYGGQPVTLSVQCIGAAPLYYDWQTDNGLGGAFSDIPSSNTNAFTFDTISLAAGTYNYQVIITNSSGSATSSVVTLNLLAASAPVVTTNTTLSPPATFVGNGVTMQAAFSGTPTIAYQWEFDKGSGPVAIAGATNATYTIASAQLTNSGLYFVNASNRIAPFTNSSTPTLLTVALPPGTNIVGAGIFDGGSAAPPVGAYDIAQLVSAPPTIVPGLNYYVDNSAPPGQTFMTGTNPPTAAGYPLNSIWLQEELSTVGSGGNTPQTYTLGIYSVTGTNATLITSYVSSNTLAMVEGDWIQWIGLTNVLKTNTTYAFSLQRNGIGWWKLANNSTATDLYTNGQAVCLPASGAGNLIYSSDSTIDAAFLISLTPPAAPLVLQDTKIKPANCYAGNPVTMQAVFSGSVPIHYQWQFWDTNGVGPINIPGATNFVYTIPSVSHTNAGTYSCLASNNAGGVPSVISSTQMPLTVPKPASYFVSDYSYSTSGNDHYFGSGVIGTGTYWNTIDTTGGNQTGLADDGSTDLFMGFASTRTWDFAHGGGIDLLSQYMLNQGSGQTTFTVNNLPNGVYNLVLFACNGHYQYSQTAFTIGGVTNNALASTDAEFVQNNNYVVFTNVVVTNGTINGLWQKAGSPEATLNGLQVELGYSFENPAVNITTQPANAVVAAGQPASFSVVASGPPPLHYQWRTNGIAINGATNSALTYSPPTIGNTIPNYDVVVTSPSAGLAATSSVVTLTIRSSVDNLVWRGYGIKWDLSSGNWLNLVTFADPAPYQQGDNVLLDDSTPLSGSVYLTGRLMPSSVTVINTNYVFNGPGYLSWNMGLNVTNASLTLATANDYTGDTTLGAGATLVLIGAGSFGNSSNLILGAGATLNTSARTDATLTLNSTQTLKGNGSYNVTGSVVNNGTLEFNVSKAGGVITDDQLQGMTGITYGGTLKLDLSGLGLASGDAIKLFNATTYAGSFFSILPATPGTGLLWNTSTLASDGTLRVVSSGPSGPAHLTNSVSGSTLSLSWPAGQNWRLEMQTNSLSSGLRGNWVDVTPGIVTSTNITINRNQPTAFYRLVYP